MYWVITSDYSKFVKLNNRHSDFQLQLLSDTILEDIKSKCCYVRFSLCKDNATEQNEQENSNGGEDEEESADGRLLENGESVFVFESNNDLEYQINSRASVLIPKQVR